ncbi:sce7726 family protein [Pelotomaculum propionicicum]|uniref:sce7726 family protein n=1 Tax=Pelotomaculum propionicicum TaxID=258475 RepID=UPI003B821008
MLLCDCDIRTALKDKLQKEYAGTHTIIVDELPICWGDTRIDIAIVNCSLIGYEIKSDRDTLDRLPRQAELYNKIFDSITLVCSQRLIAKAKDKIPEWWGIQIPHQKRLVNQ